MFDLRKEKDRYRVFRKDGIDDWYDVGSIYPFIVNGKKIKGPFIVNGKKIKGPYSICLCLRHVIHKDFFSFDRAKEYVEKIMRLYDEMIEEEEKQKKLIRLQNNYRNCVEENNDDYEMIKKDLKKKKIWK